MTRPAPHETPRAQEFGTTWELWVLGWQCFVGSALILIPVYLLAGRTAALWTAPVVALSAVAVSWLSFEARRALQADRQSHPELSAAVSYEKL